MEKDTIRVSPTGSPGNLSLLDYMECPRKCALGRQLRQRAVPHALFFGGCFHKAVELYLKGKVGIDRIGDTFAEEFERYENYGRFFDGVFPSRGAAKDLPSTLEMGRKMLGSLVGWLDEQNYDPQRVELRLEYQVPGTPLSITGRPDMLGHDMDLWDLKTCSRSSDIDTLIEYRQLIIYAWLGTVTGVFGGDDLPRVGICAVSKTKDPKVYTSQRRVVRSEIHALEAKLVELIDSVRRDHWPQNIGACPGKWRTCDYMPICFPERYEDPEQIIDQKFEYI